MLSAGLIATCWAQAAGAYVIVFEGINDIGMLARGTNATPEQHAELVQRMTAAYQQIIDRGHAHGMRVFGATITPFMESDYYKPTAANEADRRGGKSMDTAARPLRCGG